VRLARSWAVEVEVEADRDGRHRQWPKVYACLRGVDPVVRHLLVLVVVRFRTLPRTERATGWKPRSRADRDVTGPSPPGSVVRVEAVVGGAVAVRAVVVQGQRRIAVESSPYARARHRVAGHEQGDCVVVWL